MFRGWQLHPDYAFLIERGSGILEIDVLSGQCLCDGQLVPTLSIAKALLAWLKEDLTEHSIPLRWLDEASLKANFRVTERVTRNPMKAVYSGFECFSYLQSGRDIYEFQLVDQQAVYVNE